MRTPSLLLLVALSSACGGSSTPPPTPDVDGSTPAHHDAALDKGDGGSGSMDARSGATTGTFDATSACYPPCLESLVAPCLGGGPCVISADNHTCYANGVQVDISLTGSNQTSTTVSKSGQLCYTESYVGMGGTATTSVTSDVITFMSPSGAVVATEHDELSTTPPTSTLTCGGTTYMFQPDSPQCTSPDAGNELCSMGTCM
jgi:hypothetical protein